MFQANRAEVHGVWGTVDVEGWGWRAGQELS